MDFNEMGLALKKIRKSNGLTLEEVAAEVGSTKSTLSQWENGKLGNMNTTTFLSLIKYYGVSLDKLMGEDDISNIMQARTYKVNVLGEIACGVPILTEEDKSIIELENGVKADFALKCKGDSMIGAGIKDGDIVFIKSQSHLSNGDIGAIVIDNEATLKYFYFDKNKKILTLQAANDKYSPMFFNEDDVVDIRILGKAICVYSKL